MNRNEVLYELYCMACKYDINNKDIERLIEAIGLDIDDLNTFSINDFKKGMPVARQELAFN